MKIKQSTKMIILVVALVSVIGVGAVSFAAWQGIGSISASASIGNVELVGFKSDDPLNFTGSLCPYDQGSNKGSNVTMLSAALPAYETTKTSVTITVNYGTGSDTLAEGSTLYVLIDDQPDATLPADAAAITAGGWKAVGGAEFSVTNIQSEAGPLVDGPARYVHLILVSGKYADMNKTLALSIALS